MTDCHERRRVGATLLGVGLVRGWLAVGDATEVANAVPEAGGALVEIRPRLADF
jgi:ribosomal protein L19E